MIIKSLEAGFRQIFRYYESLFGRDIVFLFAPWECLPGSNGCLYNQLVFDQMNESYFAG